MTKTGKQSTKHHDKHTEEDALKKKTPTYDFFPVGESRLYWYNVRTLYELDKITL